MNYLSFRGSVSVFLILVLMPLFSGTYLAVDAGRTAAARTRLEGALDLTGNAALNDYDEALKDCYGLFAMAKSRSAYEMELSAVFSGTVDAGENIGNKAYDNFINTETQGFSVKLPGEASLARPNVLEQTVTDYMKYRGPYRFAMGVSQRLGAFQHIKEAAETLSKSQDYYDSLSGVSKQLTQLADGLPSLSADGQNGTYDVDTELSAARSVLDGLDTLSSKVKKTDRCADAWKNSLDRMPEGEAKTLLAGDYKTTAGVLNEAGVTVLKEKLNADLRAMDAYRLEKQQADAERRAAEDAKRAAEEAVAAGGEAPQGLVDPASIPEPEPPKLTYRDDELYRYIAASRTKDDSGENQTGKQLLKNAAETLKGAGKIGFVSEVPERYVSREVGNAAAAAIDAVGSSGAEVPTEGGETLQSQMNSLQSFFQRLSGSGDSLLADCYLEEFLSGSFSCYTSGADEETLAGATMNGGPLFKGEREYALFGQDYLPTNVHLAASLIFAIRVLFNSIYAFSNAKMRAEALTAATAAAAWTGVGVAVAQNLILEAWAMAESVNDVRILLKGESVPLYKNTTSWALSFSGIAGGLKDGAVSVTSDAIGDVYAAIEKTADDKIDSVNKVAQDYIDETTKGAAESLANQILAPVEAKITTLIGDRSKPSVSREEIRSMLLSVVEKADNGSAGYALAKEAFERSVLDSLTDTVMTYYESLLSLDETVAKAAANAIRNGMNSACNALLSEVGKALDAMAQRAKLSVHQAMAKGGKQVKADVTDAIGAYAEKLSGYLGSSSGGRTKHLRNTALSSYSGTAMSYSDYLTVFLFTGLVNDRAKRGVLTRTAKLMQVNCHRAESSFSIAKAYRKIELSGSARIVTHTVKGRETYAY